MDFTNFEYNKEKVPTDSQLKDEYFQNLGKVFWDEIQSSKVAQEIFSKYNPDSIESFIKGYIERKVFLAQNYEYYSGIRTTRDLRFRELAEGAINAIRQKKLFNLQVQWRAGAISIREIHFCYEFVFWGKHIEACPFISPVTKEEIELVKRFMKEEDQGMNTIKYEFYSWQDYEDLTSLNENGLMDDMNPWYDFYDTYLGTGSLLLLPDTRGEKEEFYQRLSWEDEQKKTEKDNAGTSRPYIPPLPYLHCFTDNLIHFSRQFETNKYFRELFEVYQEELKKDSFYNQDTHDMEAAIAVLEDATEPFIMPGGLPWKQAIIKCGQLYEAEMASRELDALYQEICMLQELGISRGGTWDELKDEYEKEPLINYYKKHILNGRRLNGDPVDFNF